MGFTVEPRPECFLLRGPQGHGLVGREGPSERAPDTELGRRVHLGFRAAAPLGGASLGGSPVATTCRERGRGPCCCCLLTQLPPEPTDRDTHAAAGMTAAPATPGKKQRAPAVLQEQTRKRTPWHTPRPTPAPCSPFLCSRKVEFKVVFIQLALADH